MTITPQSAEGYRKADLSVQQNGQRSRPCLPCSWRGGQDHEAGQNGQRCSVAGDDLCGIVFDGLFGAHPVDCGGGVQIGTGDRTAHSRLLCSRRAGNCDCRAAQNGKQSAGDRWDCDCIYDPCGWSAGNFSVPAGENQTLSVILLLQNQSYDILKWELTYSGDWQANQSLITVWDGGGDRHLVISTLHTVGAVNTMDRIIDVFPPNTAADPRTAGNGAAHGDFHSFCPRLAAVRHRHSRSCILITRFAA